MLRTSDSLSIGRRVTSPQDYDLVFSTFMRLWQTGMALQPLMTTVYTIEW